MTDDKRLSRDNQLTLLHLARGSLIATANHNSLPDILTLNLDRCLLEPRACFVTLHKHGELRACTGVLSPRTSLIEEVRNTTAQTALHDPRFEPVRPDEVNEIEIEISVLSVPNRLVDCSSSEVPKRIRPFVDGVTIYRGYHRATFLPQVWNKIPDPVEFLDSLCQKAGLPSNSWKVPGMNFETYQVEEFSEALVR